MITLSEGRIFAGKYRLRSQLAKGGMGSVWEAEHLTLSMPVAVKFMDPNLSEMDGLRVRFEREAKAAAQLRTPNVVQIYDYGIESDTPYIVMELLTGEDLGARLKREGTLRLVDALPIFTQLGRVLRRAHDEAIVHRDLKPANVFLSKHDDGVLVKILDFGIAKLMHPEAVGDATKTGAVMGSPHYMSPEQVRGTRDVDHRTDLWAFGVIIYRVLTGELPFPGTQLGDVFLRICTERPKRPSEICVGIDSRIDMFLEKALAVDPRDRFQSATEMVEALQSFVTVAPTPASAPTPNIGQRAVDGKTSPYLPSDLSAKTIPISSIMNPGSTTGSGLVAVPLNPASEEVVTNAPVTQQVERSNLEPRNHEAPLTANSRRRSVVGAVAFVMVTSLAIGIGLTVSRKQPQLGNGAEIRGENAMPQAASPLPSVSTREREPEILPVQTALPAPARDTPVPSIAPTPSAAKTQKVSLEGRSAATVKPTPTTTAIPAGTSKKSQKFGF